MSVLDPVVAALHHVLSTLAGAVPGGLVVAIVLLTVGVRLVLFPLALKAFRGQRALSALAPEVQRLRTKHAKDPQRLAEELRAVHRTAGVSPFAALAPMLLSAPIGMALYRMVSLLGDPLGSHWLPLLSAGHLATWALFGALLLALLVVAFLSSRQQQGTPRLMRLMPFGTVAFVPVLPVAVGVYLLSTTAFSVIERAVLPHLV